MDPEERRELILAGSIEPIDITTKLKLNEKAYISLNAKRTADIDQVIEQTKGRTRRKGVLTRGIVGGVVFGPVGALAGAVTAGEKNSSQTTKKIVSKHQIVDSGELIFTNQRILFVGNREIIPIDYQDLIDYKFGRNLLGRTFTPSYDNMLLNESYILSGPAAPEAELFFQGIINNLIG